MIVIGPGHGGPAALANCWLEGSYSEIYPSVPRDRHGMATLMRQFSFPGGVPSHVAAETPGSIHEGGELGYSLSHAYGAAFDNPDLIVACVIGDGEAETGPLATSWHSNKFLNPARDGAVLPILHLNGYKIANPAVLARIGADELDALLRGYGYLPAYVSGDQPLEMHEQMAATIDAATGRIGEIWADARSGGGPNGARPQWPMIVLRTPKGWTGPREVDGLPVEGTWRSHQVPLAEVRTNPEHLRQLTAGCCPTPRPSSSTHSAAPARAAGFRPGRRPEAGHEPARQRRAAAARPGPAEPARACGAGARARGREHRAHPGARGVARRRHAAQPGDCELPPRRAG